MVKNWQTTLAGFGVMIAGAVHYWMSAVPDLTILLTALVTGIGLVAAKDKNVTGGDIPQTKESAARVEAKP